MVEICKIFAEKILWGNQLMTPRKYANEGILHEISRLQVQNELMEVVLHICS